MKLVGSGNSKTTEARSKKQGLCCQGHIFRLKKPDQAIKSLLRLARLEGLEPPTYWFVASHSIQLSYKRRKLLSILPHFLRFVNPLKRQTLKFVA